MRSSFIERAERVLILGMLVGIALIMQRLNLLLFQVGLTVLVVSTLLQIAVGNVPKTGGVVGSLLRIALILGIVALIFGIGIALVPTLSGLGR